MNVLSKIKIIYTERIPSFLLFVSKKLQTVQTIVIFRTFSLTLEETEELMKRIGDAYDCEKTFCDLISQYSEDEPQLIDT